MVIGVGVAAGIVEFVHLGGGHDIGAGQFAVVDAGAINRNELTQGGGIDGEGVAAVGISVAGAGVNVLDEILGQSPRADAIHGAEGKAIAVGVGKVAIHPSLGLAGDRVGIDFPHGQDDLLKGDLKGEIGGGGQGCRG